MPRRRKIETDTQVYKLAAYGAKVIIEYDVSNPPPFFQPGPGVVIVGNHACGATASAPVLNSLEEQRGPSLAEIREFQARREEPERKKPLTSEDIARESGFNPQALSFEHISGIAAQMPPIEESAVE